MYTERNSSFSNKNFREVIGVPSLIVLGETSNMALVLIKPECIIFIQTPQMYNKSKWRAPVGYLITELSTQCIRPFVHNSLA